MTAQTSSSFLQQLRRNVISEICLGAAVVVIVACLGVTPPARHQETKTNRAVETQRINASTKMVESTPIQA